MADEPAAGRVHASWPSARRPYTDETFRGRDRAPRSRSTRASSRSTRTPGPSSPKRITYQRLDFDDDAGFDRAVATGSTSSTPSAAPRGNRLFYLATQPSAFTEIVRQLGPRRARPRACTAGAGGGSSSRSRSGATSSRRRRLNREVGKVFRESQVYRIDHYLGKETVRNLLVFRFGNGIFEPVWNRRYVDHVQITVAESLGVEDRGAFYEETGASRDILQNHLLQLLTLVAMEPPASFEADALRDEKVKVLRAIAPDDARTRSGATSSAASTARAGSAPSRCAGYRAGAGGRPGVGDRDVRRRRGSRSTTGAGPACPFYLRAGKRLPKRATEIAIQFKDVPAPALPRVAPTDPEPNLLAMRIQPDEGIMLRFAAKVPGLGLDVRAVNMDFTYGSAFIVDSPDAYETLILDALLGDASLFTRADEVERPGHRDADHRRLGRHARAGVPELRGRHLGPRGGRRAARTGRPPVAADLMATAEPEQRQRDGRVARWRRPPACPAAALVARDAHAAAPRSHARAGARSGRRRPGRAAAGRDGGRAGRTARRGPDQRAEPGRRRPPAGDRRARRGDRSRELAGRHPSRTLIVLAGATRTARAGSMRSVQAFCVAAPPRRRRDLRRD